MKHKAVLFFTPKLLLLAMVVIVCGGCISSVSMKATKTGKHLFETFFVGEDGTQYFVKPLEFNNETEQLLVDFTFRYRNEIKDSVALTFSIQGDQAIKKITELSLKGASKQINSSNIVLLYNSKTKKGYSSRFSTKIPLLDFYQICKQEWVIVVTQGDSATDSPRVDTSTEAVNKTFTATKSTQKALSQLNKEVFALF